MIPGLKKGSYAAQLPVIEQGQRRAGGMAIKGDNLMSQNT